MNRFLFLIITFFTVFSSNNFSWAEPLKNFTITSDTQERDKNGDFLEETENLTYLFAGELGIENCFTVKAVDSHGTVGPESNQECGTGTDS